MQSIIKLIIFIVTVALTHRAAAQGLRFHGNETDISARSGLSIPAPDIKTKTVENLDIRFSIRINNPRSSGFIFGIQNRADKSMLNLMLRYDQPRDSVKLSFAKEGERELCSVAFPAASLTSRRIPIMVGVNRGGKSGYVSIDGKRFHLKDVGLENNDFVPQLNFGLSRHIVETASVTLSDLSYDSDGVTTISSASMTTPWEIPSETSTNTGTISRTAQPE